MSTFTRFKICLRGILWKVDNTRVYIHVLFLNAFLVHNSKCIKWHEKETVLFVFEQSQLWILWPCILLALHLSAGQNFSKSRIQGMKQNNTVSACNSVPCLDIKENLTKYCSDLLLDFAGLYRPDWIQGRVDNFFFFFK